MNGDAPATLSLTRFGTLPDDLFGQRRDLLQFCHPQRSTEIGSSAIGALFIHPELGGMKVDYCLG